MHSSNSLTIRHSETDMCYTPGVQALAKENEAAWLIDLVFVLQKNPLLGQHRFQVWELRHIMDSAYSIKAFDGYQIHIGLIPAIRFPLGACTLWLVDGCLMLPAEY